MTSGTSVVVDTMVVSALVNASRNPGTAARYRETIGGRTVLVSFVTITEMRFGTIRAGWGEIRRRGLERVLARLVVVQPDDNLTDDLEALEDTLDLLFDAKVGEAVRTGSLSDQPWG